MTWCDVHQDMETVNQHNREATFGLKRRVYPSPLVSSVLALMPGYPPSTLDRRRSRAMPMLSMK